MTTDNRQDEKLMSFLKENEPQAPAAGPGEEMRIWEEIEKSRSRVLWFPKLSFRWAVPALAVAALLAVVLVRISEKPVTDTPLDQFVTENVQAVYAEEDPLLADAGQEAWLTLADAAVRERQLEEFLQETLNPENGDDDWI